MSIFPYSYAWEKFYVAISGALTSTESLQRRVYCAYMSVKRLTYVEDLHDEDMTKRLQAFCSACILSPDLHPVTAEEATSMMSDDEAEQWLQELLSLYQEICELRARADKEREGARL